MPNIAIIGLSCRFPGIDGIEDFWTFLERGGCALGPLPPARWRLDHARYALTDRERSAVEHGAYFERVDQFDAAGFGISKREAQQMDPQHRMVLELAEDALQSAGHDRASIKGSRTGVYLGIFNDDYVRGQLAEPSLTGGYLQTGNEAAVSANRISYCFDLHGPSMSVDTACSSSLVAVHLACQALIAGDATMAIAGGVNLVIEPEYSVALARCGFIAPDGSRAFAEGADGYARGEGAGLVVLKPLEQAIVDGDRIWAVVTGSAVNQDGGRAVGLTAPSRHAQVEVMRAALGRSGREREQVAYVEAHGTGTVLGDWVEAQSTSRALGHGRSAEHRLRLGSVKSNLGHLEAAAGIAGLIKTTLAVQRGVIPPSIRCERLNPRLDFDALGLEVQQRRGVWPPGEGPRIAGVSGFSFGGTNCHVIVESCPAGLRAAAPGDARPVPRERQAMWFDDELVRSTTGAPDGEHDGLKAVPLAFDPAPDVWEAWLSPSRLPWLRDHRVQGAMVLPATAYMELVLRALRPVASGEVVLESLELSHAMIFGEQSRRRAQLVVEPASEGRRAFQLLSAPSDAPSAWSLHLRGVVLDASTLPSDTPRGERPTAGGADAQAHYERLSSRGNEYGPRFRAVRRLWSGSEDDSTWAEVSLAPEYAAEADGLAFHPALLDAAGQVLVDTVEDLGAFMPTSIGAAWVHASLPATVWVQARCTERTPGVLRGDVTAYDEHGGCVAWIRQVELRELAAADEPSPPRPLEMISSVAWSPAPLVAVEPAEVETWLVLGGVPPLARAVGAQLSRHGSRAIRVEPGSTMLREADDLFVADLTSREQLRGVMEALRGESRGPIGLIHLEATRPRSELRASVEQGAGSLLAAVQAVPVDEPRRLVVVTTDAVRVTEDDEVSGVMQSPVHGLTRTVRAERRLLASTLIDLEAELGEELAAASIVAEALSPSGGEQVAIRGGQRFIARLEAPAPEEARVLGIDPAGTYLVTGGLGALSLRLARRMVERGARRMVLLGRTPLPPRRRWEDDDLDPKTLARAQAVLELERLGAAVRVMAVDVSSRAALVEAMGRLEDEGWPAIRGVVHAAGTLALRGLDEETAASLYAEQAGKLEGAWLLHQLLQDVPLDFFVLYSSLAGTVPSRRQGAYALANAFLDGLAQHRRAHRRPGASIGWPAWRDLGMAAAIQGSAKTSASLALEPEHGLSILEHLAARGPAHAVVVPSVPALTRMLGEDEPLLESLAARPSTSRPVAGGAELGRRLRSLDDEDARALLTRYLCSTVAEILRLPAHEVEPGVSVIDLGVDSLIGHEVVESVERDLGLVVPVVRVIEGPPLEGLAEEILALLRAEGASEEPPLCAEHDGDPSLPSFGQAGLWLLQRRSPASTAYNVAFALRLHDLDRPALARSFERLVDLHPALRTTFDDVDGVPSRRVHPTMPVGLDLVIDSTDRTTAELRDQLTQDSERPFDLAEGPLFRLQLYRICDTQHALLLNFHHTIIDFWSLVELMHQLAELYGAIRRGVVPEVRAPRHDYLDFVRWQRALLASPRGDRLRAYWRTHLRDVPAVLELPADRPRPATQTYTGATSNFALDTELSAGLAGLARDHGVTLYTALLAVFELLMAKLSGQSTFAVGTLATGRANGGFQDVVGYFVNLVPVRAELHDHEDFARHVRRVRDAALGALEHQDYPFPVLVRELEIKRDPSRAPLCQTLFVLQKAQHDAEALGPFIFLEDGESMDLGGMTIESLGLSRRTAQYDLLLVMLEDRGRIRGQFQYNTDLFDAASIEGFAEAFEHLARSIVERPSTPIASLTLMSAQQAEARRRRGESTEPRAAGATVVERWRRCVATHPDAVAVRGDAGSLSHRQLADQADAIAAALDRAGVEPRDTVAVLAERSAAQIAAVLAVSSRGAAYLPIDPSTPARRARFILEDSAARYVVGAAAVLDTLHVAPERSIAIDRLPRASGPSPAAVPIEPEDLAYVMYTSGSTGRPKGVEVTHRGLANHMAWIEQALELGVDDRVLYKTPVGFDASVWELWVPLLTGGSVVIAGPTAERQPDVLARLIEEHEVTVVQAVPRLLRALLADGGLRGCGSLRWVLCGGEALSGELRDRVHQELSVRLGNLYGPTEATIDATFWEATPDQTDAMVPIGRPVQGMAAYVVDERGLLCGPGQPGELFLAGPQLARGYVRDPSLTDARFVPVPWGGPHERMLRTGDRVQWRDDDVLLFLGRVDDQLKINGVRCEPAEIETCLRGHPDVADAAVVLRGEEERAQLHAFVTATSGATIDPADVRRHAASELMPMVVPSRVVVVDALPHTPSGKLDRVALSQWSPRPPAPVARQVDDEVGLEQTLRALWCELLGRDDIGPDDDFFDLGGHSLMAMALSARLGAALGVPVPVSTIFDTPTLRGLGERLGAKRPAPPAPTASGAEPPLWLVQPGGNARAYDALVEELPGCTVQTLAPFDVGSTPPPSVDLRRLADDGAAEIRARQPSGPYRLGGWSLGGTLAWEIACVLQQQGEAVEGLLLIDSIPFFDPACGFDLRGDRGARFDRFCDELRRAGTTFDAESLEMARQVANDGPEREPPDDRATMLWRSFVWAERLIEAAGRRDPGSLDSPVSYLRPQQGEGVTEPWAARARSLSLVSLEGDHYSVMQAPHVRSVGRAIRRWLGAPAQPVPAAGVNS